MTVTARLSRLSQLADPGSLYNLGNLIGFAAGLGVALCTVPMAMGADAGPWGSALHFLAGSPPAIAMSIATLIFFWGGLVYSKAWSNGAPPDPRLNQRGDLYSGIGAICLAVGLFLLGDPLLAATAGFLHAVGKFGSAFAGSRTVLYRGRELSISSLAKDLVLASRVPAFGSALMGLDAEVLPISFAACTAIWALADWKLLAPESLWKGRFRHGAGARETP